MLTALQNMIINQIINKFLSQLTIKAFKKIWIK